VILGRLAMGADYLNPACAVELYAGTATAPAAFWFFKLIYTGILRGPFFYLYGFSYH